MIIPVTHKRLLEIQTFEKKEVFPRKKNILAYFSRRIEHNKYQRAIYARPECFDSHCARFKFISIGFKRSLGTNISNKRLAS